MSTENIEIERTPGFSGADGEVNYKSANEAFHAFLEATGQKKTKENKAKFKAWLTKAKESGKLDSVLQGGKGKIKDMIDKQKDKAAASSQVEDKPSPAENKPEPMKIMGMKPIYAIAAIVAAVGLISWGIYVAVKKNKKAA